MKRYIIYSKMMNCPDEIPCYIYKNKKAAQTRADYLNTHDLIGMTYWVRELDVFGIFYTQIDD